MNEPCFDYSLADAIGITCDPKLVNIKDIAIKCYS